MSEKKTPLTPTKGRRKPKMLEIVVPEVTLCERCPDKVVEELREQLTLANRKITALEGALEASTKFSNGRATKSLEYYTELNEIKSSWRYKIFF